MKKLETEDVKISDIVQGENSRVRETGDVADLMSDIKKNGLMQPIGIRKNDKMIIYGNRRLLACERLGLKVIKCDIYEDVSDSDLLFMNLSENLIRKDITSVEVGRICQILVDTGFKIPEIAIRLSISSGRVKSCLEAYKVIKNTKFEKYLAYNKQGRSSEGTISEHFVWKVQTSINNGRGRILSKTDWNIILEAGITGKLQFKTLTVLRNILRVDQNLSVKNAIDLMDKVKPYCVYVNLNKIELKRLNNPKLNKLLTEAISEKYPKLLV